MKKVANRLADVNGEIIDIFCNGGESSEKFCNAEIGETIEVVITSKVNDSFFSKHTLAYIQ